MSKHPTARKAGKALVALDKTLTHRAARHRREPAAKAAGKASELADQPPLIALSLGTLALGAVTRRGDLVRGGARMLAAHLVATGLKTAIKSQVDRARPGHALDTGDDRLEKGGSHDHALNSFPSGHTAGAVAVARAASHEIERAAVPAGLATGAVAAAQAPSGHHYLLDTLAGGVIGWIAEAVVGAAFERLEPAVERAWRRRGR